MVHRHQRAAEQYGKVYDLSGQHPCLLPGIWLLLFTTDSCGLSRRTLVPGPGDCFLQVGCFVFTPFACRLGLYTRSSGRAQPVRFSVSCHSPGEFAADEK